MDAPRRSTSGRIVLIVVLLALFGCIGAYMFWRGKNTIGLISYLEIARFEGARLVQPGAKWGDFRNPDLGALRTTGDRVTLKFFPRGGGRGTFRMEIDGHRAEGEWNYHEQTIYLFVDSIDGKPLKGDEPGGFNFRPPRYVDDAFIIAPLSMEWPESSIFGGLYLIKNAEEDAWVRVSDHGTQHPSWIEILP